MASHITLAIFAACFVVLMMAGAAAKSMPGMVMAPAPPPSKSSFTYPSMVIGLLAFIVTFLVVSESELCKVCLDSLVLFVLWILLCALSSWYFTSCFPRVIKKFGGIYKLINVCLIVVVVDVLLCISL